MATRTSLRRSRPAATAVTLALSAAAVVGWASPAQAHTPSALSAANDPGSETSMSGEYWESGHSPDDDRKLIHQGDSGAAVRAAQERLKELGYWLGSVDGEFGALTTQAVYALQKAAGIERDGVIGPDTWAALEKGVRPSAKSESGDLIEVNLERQLLLVVSDGEVQKIFNTSTGSGETYTSEGEQHVATTPTGKYSVFRQVDAWDSGPLGDLYRPKYFNGGIAVHGSRSIPPYPASHGCVRVSVPAMDWLWEHEQLPIGETVYVW